MRYFDPIEKTKMEHESGEAAVFPPGGKKKIYFFPSFSNGEFFLSGERGEIGLDVEKKGELPFGLPVLEQK
jgi:hypothetical protein